MVYFFFFKQKTAYEMRISDWSSDVCSSDLDQGSQFTSWAWTQRLKEAGVRISMDGRGRFLDNIFIERLWRSLKYECIYLHTFSGGREASEGIGWWMTLLQPMATSCRPWRRDAGGCRSRLGEQQSALQSQRRR